MTTEAQIRANQMNAQKSTGPKTEEGKAKSRANSLKHGLTGNGIVLPEEDSAEVRRRYKVFSEELDAVDEFEHILVHRIALHSFRMDRAADMQTAVLAEKIRQLEADFVAPEGLDDIQARKLRHEVVRQAMLDLSKEGILLRRYEAAEERNFFKSVKELRQFQKKHSEPEAALPSPEIREKLASILADSNGLSDFEAMIASMHRAEQSSTDLLADRGPSMPQSSRFGNLETPTDLPFAVGRRQ